MSKIEFYKKEVKTYFLDPKQGFAKKEIVFEIRRDYLTGHISRILPFRRRRLSEKETPLEVLEGSKKDCPFCSAHLSSSTPKFIPEIAPEGRNYEGSAVLFPNSFPYARCNWVLVLSDEHFLPLDRIFYEILMDGFLLAQEGIRRMRQREPELKYSSINWNYFPQSGGGLFHPHLQVVIEDSPTSSHQKVLDGLMKYQTDRGSFFWEDYLTEEMKIGERYVGSKGNIHFLIAFSSHGILGELMVLFSHRLSIEEVTSEDWADFSQGLTRVFRFFRSKQIQSFNLAIFSGGGEQVQSWVYARLCPRMLLPPWNTSDVSYLEKLHDEVICVVSPEELCQELKPFFTLET